MEGLAGVQVFAVNKVVETTRVGNIAVKCRSEFSLNANFLTTFIDVIIFFDFESIRAIYGKGSSIG